MLRLILVRHAKSGWDDPGLDDHDRPLAPRGRRAAGWLGTALRDGGFLPETILCSSALRTRQTLDGIGVEAPDLRFLRAVYDLRDEDYVQLIRNTFGGGSPLMIVGHNSATALTAERLVGEGMDLTGFPTGAFAVIDFELDAWAAIGPGSGRLISYRVPPRG
jgi:phosphohistidine phosphatase